MSMKNAKRLKSSNRDSGTRDANKISGPLVSNKSGFALFLNLSEVEVCDMIDRLKEAKKFSHLFIQLADEVIEGGPEIEQNEIYMVNCAAMILASALAHHFLLWPTEERDQVIGKVFETIREYLQAIRTISARR